MGEVVEVRPPVRRDEVTAWIGMVIFLASWAMMFGALFFTYGGIRSRSPIWPPPGLPAIPLLLPAVNTAVIALSSLTLQLGVSAVKAGRGPALTRFALATLVLGCAFMGLQLQVWHALWLDGLQPSSGTYGSAFYGFTVIHAAHVVVGLVALAWIVLGAARGRYTAARHLSVRLWTMYWHFVGAVWLVLFLTIYIV